MKRRKAQRQGMILYLAAIVITILSLGAFALFATITMERNATQVRGNEIQVNAAAQSGAEFVRAVCNATAVEQTQMGGLANNPRLFAGVQVYAVERRGRQNVFRFTILSPKLDSSGSGTASVLNGVRYGLQNESSRLHLGTVLKWESESPGQGRRALLTLPGMTPTSADSILDWIDPDKRARTSGAELDYYQRIGVPYGPRNAIPVSLEELLLVRDVNRFLLFGTDESFTYGFSESDSSGQTDPFSTTSALSRAADVPAVVAPVIPDVNDPAPPDIAASLTPDTMLPDSEVQDAGVLALESGDALDSNLLEAGTQQMELEPLDEDFSGSPPSQSEARTPWTYLLTTLSAEKAVNPRGVAKYDLNDSNTEYLRQQITQNVDQRAAEFVLQCRSEGPLATPIDLLTATPPEGTTNPFAQSDSQGKERFYKLLDYGTTSRDVVISGRINVNEAPPEVLRAIPGFTDSLVSQVVARRRSIAAAGRQAELRHPAWLLYERLVDHEQMKTLWPNLTCGGDVYRCQVVGFLENQGTTSRFEIVVDATVKPPRQVFFKDLTMYGRGFSQNVLNGTQ